MTTYKEIFGKPIKVLTADPAPTPVSITVTAAGGAYYIDGVLQKTLELYEGNTYIFTYPSAHPFRFATAADAAGSSEYTTGVTVDSSTQITIVVASGAPNLFYYCTNHNNMGGTILTPASPSEYEGQIWYNGTTGKFRSIVSTSSWSSGAPMTTGIYSAGGGGPQTAAIVAGGLTQTGSTATTELYNGSGWSGAPNMNTSRGGLGSSKDGSQTAHLVFGGGSNSTATESFNGSAWTTTPNSLNTGKGYTSGAGTSTAALNAGRWGPPMIGNTEEWNGSSWSEQNDLNTARGDMASFGSQTAAIFAGGNSGSPPNYRDLAEQYDGTSWTALPTLNTARGMSGSGAGSATSGLVFGGNKPGPSAANESESWDGSSWTATPNLAEAGTRSGNGASGSAGLAYGDYPVTGVTEEFNVSANVVTAAAWSSGGSLSAGRYSGANAGTKNAALYAGGYAHPVPSPSYPNSTEEYNGTSWSGGGNLSNLGQGTGSAGLQTACWATGRTPNSSPAGPTVTTEEYDGSSWSGGGNLNTSQGGSSGCGTLTAGSYARGGQDHENYNGTAWTAATDSPSPARGGAKQAGTQTANIFFGGEIPGGTYINTTLEWDGSSWTTGGNMLIASAGYGGGIGTQTAAMQAQGWSPTVSPNRMSAVSAYDGSSWSSRPSLSTARSDGGNSSASPSTDAITFSGVVPPVSTATEEFTAETTALNKKNLSTS